MAQKLLSQHDYGIVIESTVIDSNKVVIDLTGKTVTAIITAPSKTSFQVPCIITDAANGEVTLTLTINLTAETGVYLIRYKIQSGSSTVTAETIDNYYVLASTEGSSIAVTEAELQTMEDAEKITDIEESIDDLNGIVSDLVSNMTPWQTWTPIITWKTVAPIGVSTKAYYRIVGKIVFFSITISASNGNGVTDANISLPVIPKTNDIGQFIPAVVIVGSTDSHRTIKIRDDGGHNDLTFYYFGTATAGQTLTISVQGFYEID